MFKGSLPFLHPGYPRASRLQFQQLKKYLCVSCSTNLSNTPHLQLKPNLPYTVKLTDGMVPYCIQDTPELTPTTALATSQDGCH